MAPQQSENMASITVSAIPKRILNGESILDAASDSSSEQGTLLQGRVWPVMKTRMNANSLAMLPLLSCETVIGDVPYVHLQLQIWQPEETQEAVAP
jgi:hypothetical protein